MKNIEELLKRIRPYTDEDKKLPEFSYSKIETYKNCPYRYDLKYNKNKHSEDTSLPLELGNICHLVLEKKGKMLCEEKEVDYSLLKNILENGYMEVDEKTRNALLGTKELKKKYFEEWFKPDNASGATYEDKMKNFQKILETEMEEGDWKPTYFEKKFRFVWDNKLVIQGFIDRIDSKTENGETLYRTVDYKTSKKIYDRSKVSTSLQFGIYALAILNEFRILPVESLYRFVLIDQSQEALTKGWEKRLVKALDKVFEEIEENKKSGKYKPSPTPLCHWCDYCATNNNATKFKRECDYYSKWTPMNKTFDVNKTWFENEVKNTERKLVF